MRVLSWEDYLAEAALRDGSAERIAAAAPIAAAIGVFDGLHIGHRALIGRVLGREALVPAVVTFRENPKRILSPSAFRGGLSTLDQRLALIASLGVELCVLIDFSGDFSKLPGRRFLSLLSERGRLGLLAVGRDFRCGHGLDTDADAISAFCAEGSIAVELLSPVQWAGSPVSSSRIRKAILEGRLEDASSMLGRVYEIDLRGARRSGPGGADPVGGQASPPPGSYEAALSYTGGATGERGIARLGPGGLWSLAGIDALAAEALCLFRSVSRE